VRENKTQHTKGEIQDFTWNQDWNLQLNPSKSLLYCRLRTFYSWLIY